VRPLDDETEYSTIVLGTTRSPGVVTLSGHERPKNWQVTEAKGTTGASNVLNGNKLGTFQASFYLVDDGSEEVSQFDVWDSFERLIKSTTDGAKPFAISVYHPDLARNQFTEVSNAGVGEMKHDGKGGATVVVKFIEFKPPKPKPAAKAAAKTYANTDEGKRSPPDPNAARKAQLASLVDEAKKP
jgi:hypothetical protein